MLRSNVVISRDRMALRYLSARLAQQIDDELMNAAGAFSLDQVLTQYTQPSPYLTLKLMELAGLACAQTLSTVYPDNKRFNRVLVCCGPGNQGGDGLVAARHLAMFGYKPSIYMPKPGSKDIYQRLHTQCKNLDIPTLDDLPAALKTSDVILDAIFGFSFKGPIRAPFDTALPLISSSGLPIVSVDIPSGWDVEAGNNAGVGLDPDVLISLTAPKEGVKSFRGRHFLGGRFVPKALVERHQLNLPTYPGHAQVVDITEISQKL
ncbi:NAD(P)H-hydrate epimerase [Mycena indigotica]|uniref:NAD(P)H-hydrate epimerase n=1 Tax=Mycena indigotica TaxID=2126181 RepID=A0A8H6W328_9AGAR|nr:NAD(P)H-hydrate epimerase [Mycena indigotica]KAF7303794.1 NAD(P)H-hydrate epimerase [Mycena indigotica]